MSISIAMPLPKQGIEGIGQDQEVVANARGGRQSDTPYRFDLIDVAAIFSLAERLGYGIKRGYAPNNWRLIDAEDHFNHAIAHAYAVMGGDTQDDHLAGFFCRAMMAVAVIKQGGPLEPPKETGVDA